MKKLISISLILILCCLAVAFVACNESAHDKITADYAKQHNIDKSDVKFVCYGEFNGVHVIMFERPYDTALSNEIVDGVIFRHPNIQTFDVYYNGNFCSLQEAFDSGLLTHDNLLTLRDVYNPPRG